MSTVLENVRQFFGVAKASAATGYRKAVEAVASGKEFDGPKLVDTLALAGKSIDGFEQDVELWTSRHQAAADLKTAAGMTAELSRLEAVETKAVEAREALRKRHIDEMQAADAAYNDAFGQRRSATHQQQNLRDRAVRVLTTTCDPSIAQQMQALTHQRDETMRQKNELGRSMPLPPPVIASPGAMQRQEAESTAHAQVLIDRQAELQRLDQHAISLGEQIAALEAKRLDPTACAIG
ncbi:MAG: hypothetical protein SH850_31035 [Planctomycetaceae bacterium]|nr:hypothetical protein [Planctomycetaceae bacterium]